MGTSLGRKLNMSTAELWDLYYTLLLKDVGCSSNAARLCELYGSDDIRTKSGFKTVNTHSHFQLAKFVLKHTGLQSGAKSKFVRILHLMRQGDQEANQLITTRCERGASIAAKLGFNETVANGIRGLDEHWNGQGRPLNLKEFQIPLGSRIALLVQVADVFYQVGGKQAALREIELRRGTWFDPTLVDSFLEFANDPAFWEGLSDPDLDFRVAALEPGVAAVRVDEDGLDRIASAFAQVVDAKSPYTSGHSERVAHYTEALALQLKLPAERVRWLRRGGLLHDLGKLGVSNAVLDKPGSLDESEWAMIRRHPEHSETILSRLLPFAELAAIAGAHHERLDGKGYPRGLKGAEIRLETRIITTADIFDALTAERPYRAAMPTEKALEIMQGMVGTAIDEACLEALRQVVKKGVE
jgi:HD-GYP domain-containing protein (c-di-GMP phosphodiesterase class II)